MPKSENADEVDESERPAKIPRIEPPSLEACFDDVNGDCLHLIMTFLHFEDLNSVAQCSRHCHDARSNPALNQTRSGTIICREGSTILSIFRAAQAGHWGERVFVGNRTHLRIEGIARLVGIFQRLPYVLLPGVTSADFSTNVSIEHQRREAIRTSSLCQMLPNLRELDVSYLRVSPYTFEVDRSSLRVSSLKCKGVILPVFFCRGFPELTELNVDYSAFHGVVEDIQMYGREDERSYLWMSCPRLERVSMKGATLRLATACRLTTEPVPQEMIIKFVRRHHPLRWLHSDLTAENVAMLQQERPEVTFVSE